MEFDHLVFFHCYGVNELDHVSGAKEPSLPRMKLKVKNAPLNDDMTILFPPPMMMGL